MTATYDADGINTPNTLTYSLALGEDYTEQDFGYVAPQSAPTKLMISGYVYYDNVKNGIVDGTKFGLNGLYAILVDSDSNTVVATTAVNAGIGMSDSGYFQFEGNSDKNYYVLLYTPNSALPLPVSGDAAPSISTLPNSFVNVSDAIGVGTQQTYPADGKSTLFNTDDGNDVVEVNFGVMRSKNQVNP